MMDKMYPVSQDGDQHMDGELKMYMYMSKIKITDIPSLIHFVHSKTISNVSRPVSVFSISCMTFT